MKWIVGHIKWIMLISEVRRQRKGAGISIPAPRP